MSSAALWRLSRQAWESPFSGVRPTVAFSGLAVGLLLIALTQTSFDGAARHLLLLPPLALLPIATAIFAWDRFSGLHRLLGTMPVGSGTLVLSRVCAAALWGALLLGATLAAYTLVALTFGPMAWHALPGLLWDHVVIATLAVALGSLVGLALGSRPIAAMSLSFAWACVALLLFSTGAEEGIMRGILRATPLHAGLAADAWAQVAALSGLGLLCTLVARVARRQTDVAGWTHAAGRVLALSSLVLAVVVIAVVPVPAGAEADGPTRVATVAAVDPPLYIRKGEAYSITLNGTHEGALRVTDESGRVLGEGTVTPVDGGSEARFELDSAPRTTPAPTRLLLMEGGDTLVVEPSPRASTTRAGWSTIVVMVGFASAPAATAIAVSRIPNMRMRRA